MAVFFFYVVLFKKKTQEEGKGKNRERILGGGGGASGEMGRTSVFDLLLNNIAHILTSLSVIYNIGFFFHIGCS